MELLYDLADINAAAKLQKLASSKRSVIANDDSGLIEANLRR
jgi:hypothetical protein